MIEVTTPSGEIQKASLTDDKSYYLNCDCMELLKQLPDKSIGLAVVDPPFGDGGGTWKRTDNSRFGGRFDRYKGGGTTKRHLVSGRRKGESPPNWWNQPPRPVAMLNIS